MGSLTPPPCKGSRKKRNARITVRMPEELLAKIQEAAEADRRSVADWIVLQLEEDLRTRERIMLVMSDGRERTMAEICTAIDERWGGE